LPSVPFVVRARDRLVPAASLSIGELLQLLAYELA
jgi:hypothetical protein